MAYTDEAKKGHIYEIQDYLRRVARDNENIPLVVPSGVYDERTEDAIRKFQREYGLTVTGKVDRETWEKLYEVYLQKEESDRALLHRQQAVRCFHRICCGFLPMWFPYPQQRHEEVRHTPIQHPYPFPQESLQRQWDE